MTSTSFVQSTRKEGYVRANLLIPHRHFVSEIPIKSGALFMITIILMLSSSWFRHQSLIDVLHDNMVGYTMYSALDLVDGYYQLLMRESDIPLKAVNTPRGMLWEWLVMPQGLPFRLNARLHLIVL